MERQKRLYAPQIHYASKKNDLSSFTLFAKCQNRVIAYENIYVPKGEVDVYAIQFKNDLYIGSSHELKRRINYHYWSLMNNRHHSAQIQSLFDKENGFSVYIIMRCDKSFNNAAEQMIIRLLQPSLNIIPASGNNERYNKIVWSLHRCPNLRT